MKRTDEIQDNELRVIGRSSAGNAGGKSRRWLWALCFGAVAAAVAAVVLTRKPDVGPVAEVFDPSAATVFREKAPGPVKWLGDYSGTDGTAYTELIQRTVNDIPLDIYIPHNAKPQLMVGTPDICDGSIVLVTQAADIRADNGNINGAFVLAGKPMAWGLSKKGYVGIIRDTVHVGVADNSPLFEAATETGGYFFRQYALVDNGVLVENEPKNKAVRKAICDRGGEIFVVMTRTRESFHDFAQALVDLDVDNAVYLVGADSYGFFRDRQGRLSYIQATHGGGRRYENYIKWVKVEQ